MTVNQRALYENNEDDAYTSYLMHNRPQIHVQSVGKSYNEEDTKPDQISKVQTPATTIKNDYEYTSQSSDTTEPLPSIFPIIPPEVVEDHSDRQNQLKPTRDASRGKSLNDKNLTELNNSEDEKTSIVSQYDQKLKNMYKNDKMPSTSESEKRIKRGVKFVKKELPKSIESLRLLELNISIGQEYCNTLQCAQRTGPRFSYLIPVSKYMVEEYLTLQFNLAVPLIIDHCQPDKPVACPMPQNGAGDLPHDYIREQNLTEEFDPSWRLPIGLYLQSTYRFRVQSRTVISDTPCSLPAAELGHSFIEFILVFQRTCDK